MNTVNDVFNRDESLIIDLRKLYESYGYKKFKMSKFEKYDLYLENKSFLRNGSIITVTDPKGRLLALKPDITLSIVKNLTTVSFPEKVYYTENVYINDSDIGEIKEITQVGLEYIGDLDIRALSEILLLAAKSLDMVGDYRIAVSHMGFFTEILDSANVSEAVKTQIVKLINDKNLHGLRMICDSENVDEECANRLFGLINICGNFYDSLKKAEKLVCGEVSSSALCELKAISETIDKFGLSEKFILDFSVTNDMNYYNGLVFQGFLNGVPKNVLSGGRYDNLVHRFGCEKSAVGFAVYPELLGLLNYKKEDQDYEVLLIYSPECDPFSVLEFQNKIIENGERCIALCEEVEGLKYGRKIVISADGSITNE